MFYWYTTVLRNYVGFKGRARRQEFWWFTLTSLIINVVLSFVDSQLGYIFASHSFGALGSLYSLLVLLPTVAVAIRRLHDTNRTGWWVLISLIPLVGMLILIFLLALDSDPQNNQYGPVTKI